MVEINSAISSLEYTHSTALLKTPPFPPTPLKTKSHFDAKMADEAYKEGLASLASGKLDEAIHSLNTSLLKCPPNQTSAVAKLQSLIAVTSKQLKLNPNN